jgi:hypothetical protein
MKYIDADKIRADIERLKKENDHIRCENKAYCRGYGDAFIDLLSSLGILEEPVSENLEKAVSEQIYIAADKHIKKVVNSAGHPGWDWTTQDRIDAFKAGEEWMAEQGAIKYWMAKDKDGHLLISNFKPYKRYTGYLDTDSSKWINISPTLSRELFPDIKLEDSPIEVTVQIRKKEE